MSRKTSYVHVRAIIDNNSLFFTVENSLPQTINSTSINGFRKKTGGIGLINTQKRLNLIYPNKHKLLFRKTSTEYRVLLSVELDVL